MSRSPSTAFIQAANARETGEVFVILLTIDEDSLDSPIRISTDNNDEFLVDSETTRGTTSRGENYIYFPANIILARDSEDSPPTAKISVDNVSQEIIAAIRSISTPPTVTIEVVLASDPDTVEASLENFQLLSVDYDAMYISGTLKKESFFNEPFPGGSILPSNFPGYY